MEAGKLWHRVTIMRPIPSADGYGVGAKLAEWEPVMQVWAEVQPLRASEVIRARQAGLETSYVVRIRHNPALSADCRLAWQGKTLEIEGFTEVGRRQGHEIMAHERREPC